MTKFYYYTDENGREHGPFLSLVYARKHARDNEHSVECWRDGNPIEPLDIEDYST
jgi:hypothetical protein